MYIYIYIYIYIAGNQTCLEKACLEKRAPMGRYTYILSVNNMHMDLARGTYSSVHVLVSAYLVSPDDAICVIYYIYIYRERER